LKYRSKQAAKDAPAISRMSELAAQYPRYGYPQVRIFRIRSVPRVADENGRGAYIWSSRWLGIERVATSGRSALIAGRTAG
jgi:hypothetical protein